MLLKQFHVGLWSKTPIWDMLSSSRYLLLKDIEHIISSTFGREYCKGSANFPLCYKVLMPLYSKRHSRDICKLDQVLLVDVNSFSLCQAWDTTCYIPLPFQRDLSSSCTISIITNVATDLLHFIYSLHRFESVSQYIRCSHRLGRIHYEVT